jgi:hypothetical protein
VIDAGAQAEKTFHFHGYFERNFCPLHSGILAHVLVLPIFRSTRHSFPRERILIWE